MPISALPTPPSRQDPTNFNDRADAFLGALPLFQSEANTLQTDVNAKQVAAAASATNAAASELAAANTSGATIWVSGTTYAVGNTRFSPINFLTYRRKTAGAGTTDPSADATNWQLLTGLGDVTLSGAQTITGVKTFSNGLVGNVTGSASQLNGQSASFYQTALGYTPVEQGGGVGQLGNKVRLGWDGTDLKAQVDSSDQGKFVMLPSFTNNQGLSQNGYQKLPGGMIMQWGTAPMTSSSTTITCPIAFPNNFFNIQITLTPPGSVSCPGAAVLTLQTFQVARDPAASNQTFHWFAIGY